MKKIISVILFLMLLLAGFQPVKAEGEALKLYIVPLESVVIDGHTYRGPEYFAWRFDANPPSVNCYWEWMWYGFSDYALVAALDITPADHAALILHANVYTFPDNLDQAITDRATLDPFFESVGIPTDWLTPSTTYRELLRKTAGMMQFGQRYEGISRGQSLFVNGITLDSNWNSLSTQQQTWFEQTLVSFGWLTGVQGNPKLRTLTKQVGDIWGNTPFFLGSFTF